MRQKRRVFGFAAQPDDVDPLSCGWIKNGGWSRRVGGVVVRHNGFVLDLRVVRAHDVVWAAYMWRVVVLGLMTGHLLSPVFPDGCFGLRAGGMHQLGEGGLRRPI